MAIVWKLEPDHVMEVWTRGPWRVFRRPGAAWRASYRLADGRVGMVQDRSGLRTAWWRSAASAFAECDGRSSPDFTRGFHVLIDGLDDFGTPRRLMERVETPLAEEKADGVE